MFPTIIIFVYLLVFMPTTFINCELTSTTRATFVIKTTVEMNTTHAYCDLKSGGNPVIVEERALIRIDVESQFHIQKSKCFMLMDAQKLIPGTPRDDDLNKNTWFMEVPDISKEQAGLWICKFEFGDQQAEIHPIGHNGYSYVSCEVNIKVAEKITPGKLLFTGLDPARSTITQQKDGSGATYVYKYKDGERLNISCRAADGKEIQNLQFYNSTSDKVIQLNTTFEDIANFTLYGSSLFCSCEENGSDYSITLFLETNRPEKLIFTGLNSRRLTVKSLQNEDRYFYKFMKDEVLDIGCEAKTRNIVTRFVFYSSSNKLKHLFHIRFQEVGQPALHGAGLLCSYEDQKQGTGYTISLKLELYTKIRKPNAKSILEDLFSLEQTTGTIYMEALSCAGVLMLLIQLVLLIQNAGIKTKDIFNCLLIPCQFAWRIIALPFAQLGKIVRRKRTDATVVFMPEWRKVVTVKMNENDSSIVPNISIEKVRYTEFSDMNISSLSEYILPVDTKWELPRERLSFGELLGEGEFGRVLRAEYRGGPHSRLPRTVAVKMLKEEHTDSDMIALVAEMEIMKTIGKHEHVVNLLGCCARGGPLGVVVEFADQGCLRDYLRRRDPKIMSRAPEGEGILTERDFVDFALQVAKGMEFLVSRGCIHRDLAARNVLVSGARTMKVADFGLARDLRDALYYRKRSAGRLPVRWMAPESLQRNYYTEHSDVWSFGVLFWEIASFGATPFRQLSVHILYDYLKSGQRLDKPDGCRDIIYALMLKCWAFRAEHRPHFSELVINLQEILNGNEEKLSIDTNSLV